MVSYKYRLKPSVEQISRLEEQLRLCRWTYNSLLEKCFSERKAGRGTPTHKGLTYLLPTMKTVTPELNTVFSQVLQNVAKRVRSGFESYWNRRKAGLKAHLPRFRRERKYNSFTYPQFGFKVEDGYLKLSKIGALRIILHRPIDGNVKTLTIKRSASGKWYATFVCEVGTESIPGRLPAVGVDFGLNSLVALSDGTLIDAPQSYRKMENQSRRARRSLSRKKRGSANREKARVRLARVEERIANRRRDFAFKTARSIVNRYELICVEDLRIDNMRRNHRLSKSIGDAGWGILRRALTYMAERSEGRMALVDPKYTSQLCSKCGEVVSKSLSERTHVCPYCGLRVDRDVNAARNILHRGLEIGMEHAELTPEGETTPTMPREVWQVASMKQEAHYFSSG